MRHGPQSVCFPLWSSFVIDMGPLARPDLGRLSDGKELSCLGINHLQHLPYKEALQLIVHGPAWRTSQVRQSTVVH